MLKLLNSFSRISKLVDLFRIWIIIINTIFIHLMLRFTAIRLKKIVLLCIFNTSTNIRKGIIVLYIFINLSFIINKSLSLTIAAVGSPSSMTSRLTSSASNLIKSAILPKHLTNRVQNFYIVV